MKFTDDLELTFGEEPEPRPKRPYARMEKDETLIPLIIVVGTVLCIIGVMFLIGRASGVKSGNEAAEAARMEAHEAANLAAAAMDSADHWKRVAEEASATAATIRVYAEEASATIALLELRAEEASETIAALKAERDKLKAERDRLQKMKAEVPSTGASQGAWSRSQVEATLRAACARYGLTAAQTAWVVETGTRIAYRESTFRVAATNASGAAGLFQFMPSWGSLVQRTDPVWSCYRFVKVYAEGGQAAIERHWAATV